VIRTRSVRTRAWRDATTTIVLSTAVVLSLSVAASAVGCGSDAGSSGILLAVGGNAGSPVDGAGPSDEASADGAQPVETSGGATGAASRSSGSSAGRDDSTAPEDSGSCQAEVDPADFASSCFACAGDDRCQQCLCTDCTEEVRKCMETPGCLEIAACVQDSGCTGINCYCGQYDALRCAEGRADGPCRDTMVNAPSGRVPTAANPSAGPASDAAVAISTCLNRPGSRCLDICQSGS
jgi:hypothetical protein